MIELKRYRGLIKIALFVAAIPLITAIVYKEFEIDVISGMIVFWAIDCIPIFIIWNIINKSKKNNYNNYAKMFGIKMALKAFIGTHLLFFVGVFYALRDRGPGFSTSVIVFIYLPVISATILILFYFISYYVAKNRPH